MDPSCKTDSFPEQRTENNAGPGEDSSANPFDYDGILKHLGQLGRSQLSAFLWLCIPAMFPGIAVMSYTFTGGMPEYRCYIPGCDDDNLTEFFPDWLNESGSLPFNEKCFRYNHTWSNPDECYLFTTDPLDYEVQSCDRWVYDQSQFLSTVITEFHLTCQDEWKEPYPNVAYMVGTLIGSVTLGALADKIGRRLTFTINVLVLAIAMTASAFSPNLITFCILRLITGGSAAGQFDIVFVWGVEAVGTKFRVMCGFIYQLMFVVGSILLGVAAYFIRDWKTLQLVISVPLFPMVALYWIVPESTRWLISQRRFSQARKQILAAAKANNKTVPLYLIKQVEENNESEESTPIASEGLFPEDCNNETETLIDIFRSPLMLKRIIITAIAWIALDLGYFGITYAANNLSGDFYLNYELTMLVEIPAYILGSFVVDWIGRRPTLSLGLVISGVACLVTGLVPEDMAIVRVVFSLTGKFFVAGVYAAVYSYTAELFPTSTRSAAVGVCSTSGRIGGILAPILADAGRRVYPALPYITFAVVNVIVGILCLLLPETRNTPFPATIQDAIELENYFTLPCFRRNGKQERKSSTRLSALETMQQTTLEDLNDKKSQRH